MGIWIPRVRCSINLSAPDAEELVEAELAKVQNFRGTDDNGQEILLETQNTMSYLHVVEFVKYGENRLRKIPKGIWEQATIFGRTILPDANSNENITEIEIYRQNEEWYLVEITRKQKQYSFARRNNPEVNIAISQDDAIDILDSILSDLNITLEC